MRRPGLRRLVTLGLLLLTGAGCASWSYASPPPQFRVWADAGPEFPPLPAGWTQMREASGAPAPTPEERTRGFLLCARDPLQPTPTSRSEARVRKLEATAARGEYEPLTFALYASRDLPKVEVRVGELRGKGGAIAADQLDVRVVRPVREIADAGAKRYRLRPSLLERRAQFSVAAGMTAQVWVTVHVPQGAASGDYRGTVTVRAGKAHAELPLQVHAYPFALPPVPVAAVMFYLPPSGSDARAALVRELTDMREHGLTSIMPSFAVQVASRDQHFGPDDEAATRAQAQMMMGAIKEVFGEWRAPTNLEVGHELIFYWDQQQNWFAFWPREPAREEDLSKAVRVVEELRQQHGWPPLRLYVVDEAGAHGLLDDAAYYYRLLKERFPAISTYTTIGGGLALGQDELGRLSGTVDLLCTNRFTPDIARALVARGRPYGVYNGGGESPAHARFFFGFYGWKTGAQQIEQWAYRFGDVFAGAGLRGVDDGFVYATPRGPLPTIPWEAVREGTEDYRYLTLLSAMIRQARGSRETRTRQAADAAERAVTGLLAQIGWQFQALDSSQRTPPPSPARLRQWRRVLAEQILALQRLGCAPRVEAPVTPPSPFSLPWAAPPATEETLGPELLPRTTLEGDLAPWSVQVWSGQGSSQPDGEVRYAHAPSLRLEIPAGESANAVTVLWWSEPNVSPEAGRTYEFSAWVKSDALVPAATLRFELPPGLGEVRTGRDESDAEGWRRLWARVTPTARTKARYLAVWLQGPSTLWVGRLSLREVRPRRKESRG